MTKVSIIIPVYNVQALLPKCLDSILAQTYTHWEAICIDDGSPDNCPKILDDYAASDSRFRVVHTKNGGVSRARNSALELAEGKYILFVDADDFIHPQLLEICVYQAEKFGSDMVAFRLNNSFRLANKLRFAIALPCKKYVRFKSYTKEKVQCLTSDNVYDYVTETSKVKIKGVNSRWYIKHCHPVKCLYAASAIQDVKFIPDMRFEDIPWWGEALKHIKRVSINSLPLYYYYPSQSSFIFNTDALTKAKMRLKAIEIAEQLYPKSDPRAKIWEERFLSVMRANVKRKMKKYGA